MGPPGASLSGHPPGPKALGLCHSWLCLRHSEANSIFIRGPRRCPGLRRLWASVAPSSVQVRWLQ